MSRRMILSLLLVVVMAAALAAPAAAQVREKKSSDFNALVEAAKQAYASGEYGATVANLRDATVVAATKQREAVVAAMPPAPAGFEKVPVDLEELTEITGASFGSAVTQEYAKPDGSGSVSIQVTANSPLVGMMTAAFGMAKLNPDVEIVKYGAHEAMFTNNDGDFELQLPLHGEHHVEIRARGLSEDAFFAMIDQECVDGLAAALGE